MAEAQFGPPLVRGDVYRADRESLFTFVSDVEALLGRLDEVVEVDYAARYRLLLASAAEHFALVRGVIAEPASGHYLHAEGLTGSALEFKIGLFYDVLGLLSDSGAALRPGTVAEESRAGKLQRVKHSFKARVFGRALAIADSVIGSIAVVAPPAGFITEIKEAGEHIIAATELYLEEHDPPGSAPSAAELSEAWVELEGATPENWRLETRRFNKAEGRWELLGSDPAGYRYPGQQVWQWTAVAATEVGVVRAMTDCLQTIAAGGMPNVGFGE